MAEEIDESGIYREDFSTESDWEVFVAQLGEICMKWEVSTTEWGPEFDMFELYKCQWKEEVESLELLKKDVSIIYYTAVIDEKDKENIKTIDARKPEYHKDLMSSLNSFPSDPMSSKVTQIHPLARLYGLRRFIVIQPRQKNRQFLKNSAEFSFFLSAATVVAAEVASTVPIFVQIYDPKWNFFLGVGQSPSARTNFNIIALDQAPGHCRYLSGLLPMFKEKVKLTHVKPATISVQNIYALEKIRLRIPMHVPFSNSFIHEDDYADSKTIVLSATEFTALPHGYFRISHCESFAVYTWLEIPENMAMDSALNTVFVPSKAPKGSIHYVPHANSYLSSCLSDYQALMNEKKTVDHYVGKNFSGSASAAEGANPLDQLTKTKLVNLTPAKRYYKRELLRKLPGPMNEVELQQMMNFLFPNPQSEDCLFPYPKNSTTFEPEALKVKSANPDSLVCRLSSLLATVNSHFGGKSGLTQLWAAFTRELTFYWDNCLYIPGVAFGLPDTRSSLLHQKLQMLNIAIERCAKRNNIEMDRAEEDLRKLSKSTSRLVISRDKSLEEQDEEEDEFYECPDFEEEQNVAEKEMSTRLTEEELVEMAMKPEGRLKRLGNMKLLGSNEPLYIPITQEPVPKTEDQLQDDAEVMLKSGPGSDLTTQMMCSSLLSDMEAFKAANPKAAIEDFIRWYSPKDWEETTDEQGEVVGSLSPRMKAPNNTWQVVWSQAERVPVSRQKRLFDDTNEALKVLYYLESRNISQIYDLTIIPLLHSAILKIKDILVNENLLDIFDKQIEQVLNDLCYLSRSVAETTEEDGSTVYRLPNPERILDKIKDLEEDFYCFKCLEHTMEGVSLEQVKEKHKAYMENGGFYNIDVKDRAENVSDMKESLFSKEYIIRLEGETTSSSMASTGPQFLRAIISGDKFRLCTAFTENTTFT